MNYVRIVYISSVIKFSSRTKKWFFYEQFNILSMKNYQRHSYPNEHCEIGR